MGVALFSRNNICSYRYSAAADQTEGKGKKNRKKIITCFSQTCICKHKAFYLLGQMAQAQQSHTFLVLFEDRERPLTSHLPPSFSEWHQMPLTVTAPLSEHFTVCTKENPILERGKPGGSAPQLCPGTGAAPQHGAALQTELRQFPMSGSAAFRHCCIHPAASG